MSLEKGTHSLSMMVRENSRRGKIVLVASSLLVGLLLAWFILLSPFAGVMLLSCAIVVVLTIVFRKTEHLIFLWFVLTSLMWLFLHRLFPQYYAFLGRAIFWGLLGCIIVARAVENILTHRQFTHFDNVPLKFIILFFLLWCILSLYTSSDVLYSVRKLSHIVIALIASYTFYDFFSQDEKNIRTVLTIVSLVMIVFSFIVNSIAVHGLVTGVAIYKDIKLWFLNVNILGSLLFICTPIMMTSGFNFRPLKRFKAFFVLLLLSALFFSFHRTSWVALLASVIVLWWKGKQRTLLAIVAVVGLLVAGLSLPLWKGEFYDFATREEFSGRKEIWKASWKVAREHPFLGVGLGNSPYTYDKYIDTPWLEEQKTHSIYLQNAIEVGVASVLVLLVFYALLIYSSNKIEDNLVSDDLRLLVRGTTATFVGLFVHGIFGNFGILNAFDAAEFHVLFPYILLAVPFAARRLEGKRQLGDE